MTAPLSEPWATSEAEWQADTARTLALLQEARAALLELQGAFAANTAVRSVAEQFTAVAS